jgi:hypothetical protein
MIKQIIYWLFSGIAANAAKHVVSNYTLRAKKGPTDYHSPVKFVNFVLFSEDYKV